MTSVHYDIPGLQHDTPFVCGLGKSARPDVAEQVYNARPCGHAGDLTNSEIYLMLIEHAKQSKNTNNRL